MINVNSSIGKKVAGIKGSAKPQGLDIEKAWMLRSMLHEFSTSGKRISEQMPNGDPPSLVLWGTDEEK